MGDMLLVTLVSMILYTDGMLPGEKIPKDDPLYLATKENPMQNLWKNNLLKPL
jgi:hypothetical protein